MNTLHSVITAALIGLCVCRILWVYLLCVSSADGGFTSPGACYWPPVTVPVSCVKSITGWQLSRYWRTLQEQWHSKRNIVAITPEKKRLYRLLSGQHWWGLLSVCWFAAALRRYTPGVCGMCLWVVLYLVLYVQYIESTRESFHCKS